MEPEVTLSVYMFGTLVVALSLSAILVLMFWISDLISTRIERKKRKTVWNFDDE